MILFLSFMFLLAKKCCFNCISFCFLQLNRIPEEFEAYTQTKKYVEEVAKERLGLVYEDEILFKAK